MSYTLWKDVVGYSKFRRIYEMMDKEAFFVLLFRNEKLRNTKSVNQLKELAKLYAEQCVNAEKAVWEKTGEKIRNVLRQHGFLDGSFERSLQLYKDEVMVFMKYVRGAEWLQYIDQTPEEIEQMLLSECSPIDSDVLAEEVLEDHMRAQAEYNRRKEFESLI